MLLGGEMGSAASRECKAGREVSDVESGRKHEEELRLIASSFTHTCAFSNHFYPSRVGRSSTILSRRNLQGLEDEYHLRSESSGTLQIMNVSYTFSLSLSFSLLQSYILLPRSALCSPFLIGFCCSTKSK